MNFKVGQKVIWVNKYPTGFKDGKWQYETSQIEVRIMAIAEGYAMVRRKGGSPFVVNLKELETLEG